MKRALFTLPLLVVFSLCLFVYADDSEYGRVVGDRKYFVEDPARGGRRDYIVRNPRATLPAPKGVPLAKMDSTPQECLGWTGDERISYWIDRPYSPRVAVVGDTIHVVWYQRFYSKSTHREVCYVKSTDGGLSWSDSLLLSVTDGVESIRPDIAVQGNSVYLVWEDLTSMDWGGIYFRKSTDGGTAWEAITPVALRGVNDYDYYCPAIAVRDSEIYVAYNRNDDLESSLRFKKSLDSGKSWQNEVIVSNTPESGHWLKLAMNSAGLHISHEAGLRIYYNRSTNWGISWSEDIFISNTDSSIAQWPSIGADDNGGVYITWFDYKYSPYPWTGDIFLKRSPDNGATWDSIISLTNNHLCIESDVCADTLSVHAVWHDERHNTGNSNVEIYHRNSTDLGATWLEETRLTDAPYQSGDPRITKKDSKLYMVWVDNRNEPDPEAIYFKKGLWYYPGDGNGDKIINTADVVYLINFLFVGGPRPNIYEAGNTNGDGVINAADVVYLINYLFVGGPIPVGCQ